MSSHKLIQTAIFKDAVENMTDERLVVVKTDGGEGEYIVSSSGADCFAALLKSLGYTAEIEELGDGKAVDNETAS